MATKTRLNVSVEPETVGRLRQLAEELGFISRMGPAAGQGNISELLDAIAGGSVGLYQRGADDSFQLTTLKGGVELLGLLDAVREHVADLVAETAARQPMRQLPLPETGDK